MTLLLEQKNIIDSVYAKFIESTPYGDHSFVTDTDVLVLTEQETNEEYILGYVGNNNIMRGYQNPSYVFEGSFGSYYNDLYNEVSNDITLYTAKHREVILGKKIYIGNEFNIGRSDAHGFSDGFMVNDDIDDFTLAPISPSESDSHFIMFESGSKTYQSDDHYWIDNKSMRINIGEAETHMKAFGTWDRNTLSVQTPTELAQEIFTDYAITDAGDGTPTTGSFQIYNYIDESSFIIGGGKIEKIKYGASEDEFSKIKQDDTGVYIETDTNRTINLKVGNTTFVVNNSKILVTGELEWSGSMYVDGDLEVTGNTIIGGNTDIDGNMTVGGTLDSTGRTKLHNGRIDTGA